LRPCENSTGRSGRALDRTWASDYTCSFPLGPKPTPRPAQPAIPSPDGRHARPRSMRGTQGNAAEKIWTQPQEPLPLLHSRRLPATGLCRLQRHRPPQKTLHQPEQGVLPQAEWKLRHISASGKRRHQTRALHGPPPIRRRVIGHLPSCRGTTAARWKVRKKCIS
jgi:hypothetical protein